MERVVVDRSFTLRQTFYVDGVAADPTGTPSVTITRLSDGSAVSTGSVTDETPAGTWSVTVSATANTLLDTLSVEWSGTVNGVVQKYRDRVEVAGGALFGAADVLAVLPTATAAQISDARVYAETEIEAEVGYALVPRFTLEHRTGRPGWPLFVYKAFISAIRSASVDGTALTAPQLADLSFTPGGIVAGYEWGFTGKLGAVTIGYEHGLEEPPPGARKAALDEAVAFLGGAVGSGTDIDPRATRVITVDGEIRLRDVTGTLLSASASDWVRANRLPSVA